MVLLNPTVRARRKLGVCERYAHILTYNVKKSVCLVYKVVSGKIPHLFSSRRVVSPITITLNAVALKKVSRFKYIGHFVTDDLQNHVKRAGKEVCAL